MATCKIGMEPTMTPADYPMVRIVPSRVRLGSSIMRRGIECLIYFGQPIHDFSGGTEQQWADLLAIRCRVDGICRRQGTGAKKPARGGLLAGPD